MNRKKMLPYLIAAALLAPNFGQAQTLGGDDVQSQKMETLPDFNDRREVENARRGLIDAPESLEIRDAAGKLVWSQDNYHFLEGATVPDTANPILWRNAQLNHLYGLFEVTDGIYQVRGYDMANITFIRGDSGWIVLDPLMSTECSKAALELVEKNFGVRPIKAIIISHPHIDHYGGIKGVVKEEDVLSGKIPVIVPEGFEKHAVSENLYAGPAMGRRAGYQYGTLIAPGPKGALSIGIGLGQSKGTISYLSPTETIRETGETRVIDGVAMEFQLTPDTEAPVEMNIWFPDKKAFWAAENCTATLHNLYTLRGAQIRDGNAWSRYIMESIGKYGGQMEVVFQAHNWPHWGNAVIGEYMLNTAAAYKFINDQTLMYINQGDTSEEIAAKISLPDHLAKNWYTRQYYGTVAHNAKAVYQKYMGWYDANPIHLAKLQPAAYAKKMVEYIGGPERALALARRDFDQGQYQWTAEITNALVFADPENHQARALCADALEKLAWKAESGTWRNAYLSGAKELREGVTSDLSLKATGSMDIQKNMTPEMMLDYMGILLDANAAQDLNLKINLRLDDGDYLVTVKSGVLLYQKDTSAADADATLTMPKEGLFAIFSRNREMQDKLIRISGRKDVIALLTEHMVVFPAFFPIVEP